MQMFYGVGIILIDRWGRRNGEKCRSEERKDKTWQVVVMK